MPDLGFWIVVAISAAFTALVVLYFFYSLLRGPRGRGDVDGRFLAEVKCHRCSKSYECEWIPNVGFHAIGWGSHRRYQKCLVCHELGVSEFVKWANPPNPSRGGT